MTWLKAQEKVVKWTSDKSEDSVLILDGSWEFANLVYMCFVDLQKTCDRIPPEYLEAVTKNHSVLV